MWTANYANASVSKITPTGTTTTYTGVGTSPEAIAFDGANMWTANYNGGSISEITPTGSITTFGGIAKHPKGIVSSGGSLWITNTDDDTVSKITPMAVATSLTYVIAEASTPAPAVTASSGVEGGTSVTQQVQNLLAMGNTARAAQIESQWPQLFANATAATAQPSAVQLPAMPASASSTEFTRNVTLGMSGADVQALQQFLNAHGFAVAANGAGSAGHETTLFGALTKAALAKYQAANGISPAVGYFGPITRAYIAAHP